MRTFRNSALILLLLCFVLGWGNSQAPATPQAAPNAEPVNPDATPEARGLLKKIDAISGHYALTGQHNFPNSVSRWSDRVYDLTGKFPAIFGQDFGFAGGEDKDSVLGRPSMIAEVERQYRNGAVIALTWHAVRPTDDEPVTFRDSVQGHLTDFEWHELLTPGTDLYKRWAEQVDVIAGYLQQLQEAGVPVLFRAYHEMNGNWFWWGSRPGEDGSAALYRQIYDRFVHVHHLNNLIWVWNVNSPNVNAGPINAYFPGEQYCDIVTMDIYGEFMQSDYNDLLKLAGNKPIALAEVGAMPGLDVLAKEPRWAYFMMWSGMAEIENSPEKLQAIFHAPNLLNRGNAPFTPNTAPEKITIEAVTPDALPDVGALLERLKDAEGTQTLSGQDNNTDSVAGALRQVFAVTGKHPAIYGAELDTSSDAKILVRQVVDEAIRQSRGKSMVSLRWLPPSPTEMATGANHVAGKDNGQQSLTDFEWNELMTPGTDLNQHWTAQVDAAAHALKELGDRGVAVLWSPYPESNGKKYWWAGRSGIHGSAALYRMLFDRLVNQDHVRNLAWVWEAAPAGFGPGGNGAYPDYFPGYLYADLLALDMTGPETRFRSDAFLHAFALGKMMGLYVDGTTLSPAMLDKEKDWSWFMLAPQTVSAGNGAAGGMDAAALSALYADPQVVTH